MPDGSSDLWCMNYYRVTSESLYASSFRSEISSMSAVMKLPGSFVRAGNSYVSGHPKTDQNITSRLLFFAQSFIEQHEYKEEKETDMPFKYAQRLEMLPKYLFAELDRIKSEQIAAGKDIIDLGVGDPDLPTSAEVVEALQSSAKDPANHIYPSYSGMDRFREVAAEWFYKRFGVKLDYKKQVLSLIGSKEGIAHFPLAFVNPGDVVLYTEPGTHRNLCSSLSCRYPLSNPRCRRQTRSSILSC